MTMPAHIPHPTLFAKQIVLCNTVWPKSEDAYMRPSWLLRILKNRFAYKHVILWYVTRCKFIFLWLTFKHFLTDCPVNK